MDGFPHKINAKDWFRNMNMKILYVAGSAVPSSAANSVHVMKMSQALSDTGHTVILACPLPKQEDNIAYDRIFENYGVKNNFLIKQHCNTQTRWSLVKYASTNAFYSKKNKVDIVFSRCLLSAYLCSLLGVSTIFERHDSFENQGTLAISIFKSLMKKKSTRGLVVISHALKNEIIRKFNISDKKIFVAPDAADELQQDKNPPPLKNKSDDKLNAGYVGHLYKGRGIEVIVHLAKSIPNIEFHIVGGTNDDINYWREKLNSLSNIHLYGHLPHREAVKYLQQFDVLLAPYQKSVSVSQGGDTARWMSPLKIFEYMATGKPMICSDLPVLKEVLKNRENSYLCAPEDLVQWENTLNYIQENPDEALQIGLNARNDFIEKYTWKIRAKKILDNLALKHT